MHTMTRLPGHLQPTRSLALPVPARQSSGPSSTLQGRQAGRHRVSEPVAAAPPAGTAVPLARPPRTLALWRDAALVGGAHRDLAPPVVAGLGDRLGRPGGRAEAVGRAGRVDEARLLAAHRRLLDVRLHDALRAAEQLVTQLAPCAVGRRDTGSGVLDVGRPWCTQSMPGSAHSQHHRLWLALTAQVACRPAADCSQALVELTRQGVAVQGCALGGWPQPRAAFSFEPAVHS